MKVLVSSNQLLQYLCRIQEYLKGEAKLRVCNDSFEIDGFKGLEVTHKGDISIELPVQKIIELKNLLMRVQDQPICLKLGGTFIEIQTILI